jgi:hypothetical protein
MGAVPVTIVGIETREDGSSSSVTIVGIASLTGLSVGGGPASPPLYPSHPIVLPPSGVHPEHPIYNPPGIWGPTDPRPTHPIVIPPPPDGFPNPPEGVKPPPPDGGWGYSPEYGWGYFPSSGQPGPK